MRLMQRFRRRAPSRPPALASGSVAALVERLNLVSRVRLGRALLIERMDAGDCGACGMEVEALNDLVRQLEHLGLRFVHQPRNADVLLVTGPVTTNLREALERTWLALPEPRWVIAVGDCAVDGGRRVDGGPGRPGRARLPADAGGHPVRAAHAAGGERHPRPGPSPSVPSRPPGRVVGHHPIEPQSVDRKKMLAQTAS